MNNDPPMHEDTRLEYQIGMCSVALRGVDFSQIVGELNAGDNSPLVRMPMAYAMFKALIEDIGDDPDHWAAFLTEALAETIRRYR